MTTERIITIGIATLTFGTLAYMVVYIALYGVFGTQIVGA